MRGGVGGGARGRDGAPGAGRGAGGASLWPNNPLGRITPAKLLDPFPEHLGLGRPLSTGSGLSGELGHPLSTGPSLFSIRLSSREVLADEVGEAVMVSMSFT